MYYKHLCVIVLALAALPATAQQVYKCPAPTPGAPPVIQQMPCTPTGGGESVTVKAIPQGAGSGLSDDAKGYMAERDKHWSAKEKAAEEERQRQEALNIERAKAAAEMEQAKAQYETARAILITGRR